MKLSNENVRKAAEAVAQLCHPTNRLPVLAQLAAARNLSALRTAWAPVNDVRNKLVEEHGEQNGQGFHVKPTMPGWPAFVKACELMGAEEQDVPVQPLKIADIEAGYSRDPETGKRGLLEIGAEQLGDLIELEIITGCGCGEKSEREVEA